MKISISIGEPTGIGLEVILKALDGALMDSQTVWILYGNTRAIELEVSLHGYHMPVVPIDSLSDCRAKQLNVFDVYEDGSVFLPGKPSSASGIAALKSLSQAFYDVRLGHTDALVTAPIDKKNMQQDGFSFPGHTEYLAQGTNSEDYLMLLVSGSLRVGVVTGHIPLSQVASSLTPEAIISKLRVMSRSIEKDFGIHSPRIAVLGLNPHAGDGGLLGKEEGELISPAISLAQNEGIQAHGPFPADGLFGSGLYKSYDGILGMYHDQGLVPFKAISFGTGVNFTAGLPIVRCSPDHGTAYDIAGKNKADSASMKEALELAVNIVANRKF